MVESDTRVKYLHLKIYKYLVNKLNKWKKKCLKEMLEVWNKVLNHLNFEEGSRIFKTVCLRPKIFCIPNELLKNLKEDTQWVAKVSNPLGYLSILLPCDQEAYWIFNLYKSVSSTNNTLV